MTDRTCTKTRKTSETEVKLKLNLDGSGASNITTGIGFLDHMLTALAKHGRFDLELHCDGDLHIDDHHTAEDCAITIGEAFNEALGEKRGIVRFGYAYAPLDESLARTVVDISGRPHATVNLDLRGQKIGTLSSEMMTHFFISFAMSARLTLHVDVLRGENDHHRAEAAMKSFALALRAAKERTGSSEIPSTKGAL